jgi:hypothetical protein
MWVSRCHYELFDGEAASLTPSLYSHLFLFDPFCRFKTPRVRSESKVENVAGFRVGRQ